jgi:hypothetical protein
MPYGGRRPGMNAEPRKDAHGPRFEDGETQLLLRRRRADWSSQPRGEPEQPAAGPEINRAAVQVAAATLAAYDGQTGGHSDDVVTLCESLADRLGLEPDRRTRLLAAAQLHDIGKVAVPPVILGKPGPLSPDEWATVREHTLRGELILSAAPELSQVGRIVRHSHERWDGQGYPDGLVGSEIPLESRIVFCADAFHAIRCDRPYRPGRPAAEALEEVRRGSGTQFDPSVVQALSETAAELRATPRSRLEALTASVGSRRLLVLLLALVMGGSAVAAPWSPFNGLFGGADGQAEALTCDGPCLPGDLGNVARLRATAAAPGGVQTAGELGRRGGGGSREPGDAPGRDRQREHRGGSGNGSLGGDADGGPLSGRPGPDGGSRRGGSAPGRQVPAGGGGSNSGYAGDQGVGRSVGQGAPAQKPPSPGRSGDAPGEPGSPGPFGPGGRSGEAPGKPDGPGQSGQHGPPTN